jgi:hypothetical protein
LTAQLSLAIGNPCGSIAIFERACQFYEAPSIDCVERIALSTQCGQPLSASKNANCPILASANHEGTLEVFSLIFGRRNAGRTIDLILASLAPLGPFATHLFFPVVRIVACVHALASAALSISCIARIE